MDGACHKVLSCPTLTSDQHGQMMSLQPLYLLDHAAHGGTCANEPRQEQVKRAFGRRFECLWGSLAHAA